MMLTLGKDEANDTNFLKTSLELEKCCSIRTQLVVIKQSDNTPYLVNAIDLIPP